MSSPSDLIAHYSTKAFYTRISALTFVGAVLGAALVWIEDADRSKILGIALLLVVGSLAELNRRYTYSYLCACRAATLKDYPDQHPEAANWRDFAMMNEGPWRQSGTGVARVKPFLNRFLLTWATYLPGLFAGLFLTSRGGRDLKAILGLIIFLVLFAWWIWHTVKPLKPEAFLDDARKSSKTGV
jgi:hypothetical protein